MHLSVVEGARGRSFAVEVEPDTTVEVIKLKLSSAYQLNYNHIRLLFGGRVLDKALTVQQLGLQDNASLLLELLVPGAVALPSRGQVAPQRIEAQRLLDFYLGNPAELDKLLQADPTLFEAVASESAERVAGLLAQRGQDFSSLVDSRGSLLSADLNADYQRSLEERITAERLHQLEQDTYEHYPELFVPTEMLFISGRIGNIDTEIFVDTGAQTTIITKELAERTNVLKNVDRRYAITVSGVGTQKALGRIWQLPLALNGKFFVLTCTVLENFGYDILLGLDMMKRYRCTIDFSTFSISFGGEGFRIPFLTDHQLSQIRRRDSQQKVDSLRQALSINDSTAMSLLENAGFDYKKALELGMELRRQRRI